MFENPNFLKKKYDLHNAPETEAAAKRAQILTGEKVPKDPADRIQNYLDRLERLILDPEKKQKRKSLGDIEKTDRPRALALLREMVMNKYVRPNKEKMAQAASRVEENAARQMGIQARYGEEQLEQRGEIAVGDLESSLDQWINYLSDPNESYPVWFRYYAFRNVLNLQEFNKDKQEFPERSKGTVKLFPDVDRGALAYMQEMIEASQNPEILDRIREAQKSQDVPEGSMLTKKKAETFAKLPFAKQFAEGISQAGSITPELRVETRGEWVKYEQGEDPKKLWASLQNKGTAWCTRGYPTAKTQLDGGDFYVYYTLDKQGNNSIPRLAIRMEGHNKISNDVRGVLDSQQNVEGNMTEILEVKLQEFGSEADRFKKKSSDMKHLTAIYDEGFKVDEKTKERVYFNAELSKDELVFLYEINDKIEGFGYEKDPRIKEIRKTRNPEEDAPIVFECRPDQIAHNQKEINENTRVYVGKLFKDIFQKLPDRIEHIYTKFPEGKLQKYKIEIGGKTKDQLKKKLEEKNIIISGYADDLLKSRDFTVSNKIYRANLISLTVKELGLEEGATTDRIYEQAKELGLDLCPVEVGPQLRLQDTGKEGMLIAMKQIADCDDSPDVFNLHRLDDRLELDVSHAYPASSWSSGHQFIFLCRKLGT